MLGQTRFRLATFSALQLVVGFNLLSCELAQRDVAQDGFQMIAVNAIPPTPGVIGITVGYRVLRDRQEVRVGWGYRRRDSSNPWLERQA